ncbi:alpha/beta hydrolase [Burkholderia sp. R-69980]|nr:alpha/beta hydrolase [Burkholderia sp. R-69980]
MQTTYLHGSGGVRLAADIRGEPDAPAVILLHGGGQTRFSWGLAAERLGRMGYRTISLDLRGHGESDWALDGDYSIGAFAADVVAVAATLAHPPAIIGASLGGVSSLVATGESATPIARALVLVDVVPKMQPEGIKRIRDFMSSRPDGFANVEEVADAVARYLPNRRRPAAADGLKRNLRTGDDGRLYWHWDPAFQQGDRAGKMATMLDRMERAARQVHIPTLLVRGKDSEVVLSDGVQHLRALMPHALAVDVEGAGHMVAGDKNDAFNAAIEKFLLSTDRG